MADLSKLVEDPDWGKVEATIMQYVDQVLDMTTIDLAQSAEAVKAEVVGRLQSRKSMLDFLEATRLVQRPNEVTRNNSPFK